ncbi:MAG: hypothetical protein IK103_00965 [Bacteroidales bacterium]|nr:hypothetical protein [Bacteroidales bacterium]
MKKILSNYLQPVTKVYLVQTEAFICQSGDPNSVPDPDDYDDGGEGFDW